VPELVLNQLYTDDGQNGFTLQLLEHGQPVADAQISIFRKTHGAKSDPEPLRLRTDQQGIVVLAALARHALFPAKFPALFSTLAQALSPVPRTEYLASAVIMKEGDAEVAWHSHWASTTFSTR